MHGYSFPWLGNFYMQYEMRSAKLRNHLNHKIETTKVWDLESSIEFSFHYPKYLRENDDTVLCQQNKIFLIEI